jgi:hypothetical protein
MKLEKLIKTEEPELYEYKEGGHKTFVNPSRAYIDILGVGTYWGGIITINTYEEHQCGAAGYDPLKGDCCKGCDEYHKKKEIMDATIEAIMPEE